MVVCNLRINPLTNHIKGYKTYPIDPEIDEHIMSVWPNEIDMIRSGKAYLEDGVITFREDSLSLDQPQKSKGAEIESVNINSFEDAVLHSDSFEAAKELIEAQKAREAAVKTQAAQAKEEEEARLKEFYGQKNARIDAELNNIYYSALCLVIKDENEYLTEWLDYHLGLGVDHIYIYDNGSEKPVSEFLGSAYGDQLDVINFPESHPEMQVEAYNHCCKTYGPDCRWIGFIDSDEFVELKHWTSVNQMLEEFEGHGALHIQWVLYGAGGQEEKTSGPVRERFTMPSEARDGGGGKLFVQPARIKRMHTHHAFLKEGNIICNENGQDYRVSGRSVEKVALNHYITKSYEEWLNKLRRGSSMPGVVGLHRRHDDFFRYNPDMVYLRSGDTGEDL